MSRVEERPTRAGLARAVFGSGPIGLIKPFSYKDKNPCVGDWTEQDLIADSMTLSDTFSRAETVVITNT